MNRRDTIKTLMAASGALVALPAWAEGWTPQTIRMTSSIFSPAQQRNLTVVADTIIPQGNAIGALSVGVDKFLEKLFADCYEAEVQDNLKTHLDGLDRSAQSLYGKAFAVCDQQQREGILIALAEVPDSPQGKFFDLVKSETIRGFNTSREVMVDYLHFRQVPGHYHGCVDVNT